MSQPLLLALVVVAGAACPLHMWWQNRRGHRGDASGDDATSGGMDTLRGRQAQISDEIAQLDQAASHAEAGRRAS